MFIFGFIDEGNLLHADVWRWHFKQGIRVEVGYLKMNIKIIEVAWDSYDIHITMIFTW